MIPVLVEMDTTTVSATGLVIPFCSDTCRREFAVSTDTPAAEGCTFVEGEEHTGIGAFPEDTRCAYCGEPLDDVSPNWHPWP